MNSTTRTNYNERLAHGSFRHSDTARPNSNTRPPKKKKGKVYVAFFSPNKDDVMRRKRKPTRDGRSDNAGVFVAVFSSRPEISPIPGIEPDPSDRFQSTHQCQVVGLHYEGSEELNLEPQDIPLSSQCWGSFENEIADELANRGIDEL